MKQKETTVRNNRCGAELKAMASNVYGDHLCALTFLLGGCLEP
jgi:hypothetical protein